MSIQRNEPRGRIPAPAPGPSRWPGLWAPEPKATAIALAVVAFWSGSAGTAAPLPPLPGPGPAARSGEDEIPVRIAAHPRMIVTPGGALLRGFAWLPEGWLRPGDPVSLHDGRRGWPVQSVARTTYPDGSVRSIGLITRVPKGRANSSASLGLRRGAAAAPSRGVRWMDDGDRLLIDNGVLTLAISREGPDLLPILRTGSRSWRGDRPSRLILSTAPSTAGSAEPGAGPETRSVRVVLDGDLRVRVQVDGQLFGGAGAPVAGYRMHFDVFLGSPVVEGWIEVSGNGAPTLVDEVTWELPTSVRVRDVATVPVGAKCSGDDRLVVAALDGRRIRAWTGSTALAVDGEAPSGVLCRDRRGGAIGWVVRGMRRMDPRSVEVRPDGVLRLLVHAAPLFMEPGVRLRAAFAFGAVSRSGDERGLVETLRTWPRPALIGGEPPPGSLDPSIDPRARLREIVDLAVARVTGQADHGDYRIGSKFANDPAKSFLLSWLDGGDARDLRIAEAMLSHLGLQDLSDGERGTEPGFPFVHGEEHRSGRVEAGHVWTGGMALLAATSDAPWVRNTLERMRAAVLQLTEERGHFRAERDYGWMLLALVDLREALPGPDLDRAIRDLRGRLLRRQERAGYFAIDAAESGALYAPTPWVTAGITVEALYRSLVVLPDPAGDAALARAIGFVLRDAKYPDGRYAARVRYGVEGLLARDGIADSVAEWMIAAGMSRAASGGNGPARAELQVLIPRAAADLKRRGLGANQAARALAALRAIADG